MPILSLLVDIHDTIDKSRGLVIKSWRRITSKALSREVLRA